MTFVGAGWSVRASVDDEAFSRGLASLRSRFAGGLACTVTVLAAFWRSLSKKLVAIGVTASEATLGTTVGQESESV